MTSKETKKNAAFSPISRFKQQKKPFSHLEATGRTGNQSHNSWRLDFASLSQTFLILFWNGIHGSIQGFSKLTTWCYSCLMWERRQLGTSDPTSLWTSDSFKLQGASLEAVNSDFCPQNWYLGTYKDFLDFCWCDCLIPGRSGHWLNAASCEIKLFWNYTDCSNKRSS